MMPKDDDEMSLEELRQQETVTVDTGCARCGGHHEDLELKKFENPVVWTCPEDGTETVDTHYGICPETGEPLLARWEAT